MLEYETANPGQDAAKPIGEHFDPDAAQHDNHVSFAPKDEASQMEEGRIGTPEEYGEEIRPYSTSPAPPNANDQFAGLEDGMHSHERNTTNTADKADSSDRALYTKAPPLQRDAQNQVSRKPAMKSLSQGSMGPSKERSVRHNTSHNRSASGGMGGMGSKGFYDDYAKE